MSVKNKVLSLLCERKGEFLSGQSIAEELSVTRAAVWKAVSSLKNDGYEIVSITNKGYCLSENNDLLSENEIRSSLWEKYKSIPIITLRTVDSTNNEAKRRLSGGGSGTFLICAEEQSAGRGRNGKSFFSPEKTGVYMTIATDISLPLEKAVRVTTAAAVAVVSAIEKLTDKKPQIKWVNDVFLDGKKICGILTEAVSDFETRTAQSVIVGIGINVSTDVFPDEIKGIAGSLKTEKAIRNALISEITNNFLSLAENLSDKEFMDKYRAHSLVLGRSVSFVRNGEAIKATAVNIDDNGSLEVETENGENLTLNSGEISIRL